MTFPPRHVVHRHVIEIDRPMPGALELFTPQGERAWAEGWDPAWHSPGNGETREGMVFTTDHGNEHTIWTMTRHEPAAGNAVIEELTEAKFSAFIESWKDAIGRRDARLTLRHRNFPRAGPESGFSPTGARP